MSIDIDEAIKIISQMIKDEEGFLSDNTVEAHKMAIKALEQKPCEDCISRQAVKDLYYKNGYIDFRKVCELPPVTPQQKTEKVIKMRDATSEERELIGKYIKSISKPTGVNFWNLDQEPKTGHWIEEDMFDGDVAYRCSECGQDNGCDKRMKFCPNCGCRMVEPQERSDKE